MSDLIPKGRYRARAIPGSAQLGYTSKGTEQIVVEFELLDEQWAGRTMTWYGFFSEKTQERTIESLRIAGWSADDLTDMTGLGMSEVSLAVDHEEYKGKMHASIAFVNKPGGLKSPMSDAQRKAFAARMKGAAVASRVNGANGAPVAPARAPAAPAAAPGDDDVPF